MLVKYRYYIVEDGLKLQTIQHIVTILRKSRSSHTLKDDQSRTHKGSGGYSISSSLHNNNNLLRTSDSYLELEENGVDIEAMSDLNSSSMAPLNRPASFAYASASPAASFANKLAYYMRVNSRGILATVGFLTFVFLLSSDTMHTHRGGSSAIQSITPGSW